MYVTLFPCNECTKAIIQSGIAEVVYYGDKYLYLVSSGAPSRSQGISSSLQPKMCIRDRLCIGCCVWQRGKQHRCISALPA